MLLSFEGLSPSDEVEFTTVAAPIFDRRRGPLRERCGGAPCRWDLLVVLEFNGSG